MADVLHVPRQPDGQSYYQPSALRRSPPSSSALFLGTSPSQNPSPPSKSILSSSPQTSSVTSSPPSSTADLPSTKSFSTPLSGRLSLEDKYSDDNEFSFPDYENLGYLHQSTPLEAPPSSPDDEREVPDEEPAESTTTDTTRSDSPLPTPTVVDDTAIKQEPQRHVDYLSHDWREEDIWASWRHIVSQRKVYGKRSRLENASWRTWAKSKYRLRTISPEALNWLKESDVTWLYGPLQLAQSHPITSGISEPSSHLSTSNSFIGQKKPILKKRSMSEVMLQRSISTSSLVKQAAASVQAQQSQQVSRTFTEPDFVSNSSGGVSEVPSREDYFSSRTSSSPGTTPGDCGQPKRHIRFDETVEQCIAVECKDDPVEEEEDDDGSEEDEQTQPASAISDSSSDDGLVMMKRERRPGLGKRTKSGNSIRSNSHNGRKMIETLPASTLKYRTESPDIINQQSQQYTFGTGWGNGMLSPSPSQETLRPSNPSKNFLLRHDDDEEPESSSWSFGANNAKSSLGAASSDSDLEMPKHSRRSSVAVHKARKAKKFTIPADDDWDHPAGMRRTNSGMFMPYEDEDDIVAAGLFGRVSETINTAKDIAHVIWNVGWRK